MDANMVTLKELGNSIGMDSGNLRKYIKKFKNEIGVTIKKTRSKATGNQMTDVLSSSDAKKVEKFRRDSGYGENVIKHESKTINSGYFYIVQLIPEVLAGRVKMGFSTDIYNRMLAYRSVCPKAKIVKKWPCKQVWERAAMDAITKIGSKKIGVEVYEFDDLDVVIKNANSFFDMLPKIDV